MRALGSSLCVGTLLVFSALCLAGPAGAREEAAVPAGPAGEISLDFRDIELAELIQTIGELTGRNFLFDDAIKGKVTIISPKRMSLEEAYKVFLSVLNVKGYTVVPSGKVNKIVSIKGAKESNLPTQGARAAAGRGEQYVTRLIPLEHIDAATVASAVLSPLVPKTSHVAAYPPSNTLIVTDSAANIERLYRIVKELDVESSAGIMEIIPLRYAAVDEIARICNEVLARPEAIPSRRRAAAKVPAAGGQESAKIIPHVRTNALVVMASAEDLAVIRALVARLDQKPAAARAGIYVYYLENADAGALARTLNEMLTGIKAQARAGAAQAGQAQVVTMEGVKITADRPTNALVINATPEDYETLREIIAQLDIKRKQVFVEALILELSMDAVQRLGVSLQGAVETASESVVFGTSNLNAGPVGIGDLRPIEGGSFPSLLATAINGLLLGGLFSPITVTGPDGTPVTVPALSALIDLSETDTDVNILSAPRLLTSDNEEAEIRVGSNVPIITQRLTDTGGAEGLATSVAVERQDVALILRFTPQITEGDLVRLNVYQEITEIARPNPAVGDVNEVGPTFTKRLLTNTVVAEDRRTVVLGGLFSTNVQEELRKVPLLGDIPLLGWLFRSKREQETKTSLLIFITPKIIRDPADLARVTQGNKETMNLFQQREDRELAPPGSEFLLDPAATGGNGETED